MFLISNGTWGFSLKFLLVDALAYYTGLRDKNVDYTDNIQYVK